MKKIGISNGNLIGQGEAKMTAEFYTLGLIAIFIVMAHICRMTNND